LAWTIKYSEKALRDLKSLDQGVQRHIVRFLRDRLATYNSPRDLGDPLHGELKGMWRYRVGDYRVICQLLDSELMVLALRIGHRREVYR
jgi:mRNA interferase RelE/StbE